MSVVRLVMLWSEPLALCCCFEISVMRWKCLLFAHLQLRPQRGLHWFSTGHNGEAHFLSLYSGGRIKWPLAVWLQSDVLPSCSNWLYRQVWRRLTCCAPLADGKLLTSNSFLVYTSLLTTHFKLLTRCVPVPCRAVCQALASAPRGHQSCVSREQPEGLLIAVLLSVACCQ